MGQDDPAREAITRAAKLDPKDERFSKALLALARRREVPK